MNMIKLDETNDKRKIPIYVIFLSLVLLAALVRLPGMFSEFWFDEIWTLNIAKSANSTIDIFTKIRNSNNHHLNTLFFYLLGDRKHWELYRLHSFFAGIGTVVLSWFIARKMGRLEALLASILTCCSYLLIHFSSEARGYALVIFFAFASYLALQDFAEKQRWFSAVVFWFCVCLGFLSHLMYMNFFIAAVAWLLFKLFGKYKNKVYVTAYFFKCFGVPLVFLLCFYIFAVRGLVVEEASFRLIDILIKTLSHSGGGPAAGPIAAIVGITAAGLTLFAIVQLSDDKKSEWVFYLTVIFLLPAVALSIKRPGVLYERYFLISIAFNLVVSSHALAWLYRKNLVAKIAMAVLLFLFIAGNGINTFRFFKYGRGNYLESLLYMAEHTPGNIITISSDHDAINGAVIDYYRKFLPKDKIIKYIPNTSRYVEQTPMWLIIHHKGPIRPTPPNMFGVGSNIYERVKYTTYPYCLSGFDWLIYRRKIPDSI